MNAVAFFKPCLLGHYSTCTCNKFLAKKQNFAKRKKKLRLNAYMERSQEKVKGLPIRKTHFKLKGAELIDSFD